MRDGSFAPFALRTRHFTSADVQRMLETGILAEGGKLESRRSYIYRLDPASGYGTPQQVRFEDMLEACGVCLRMADLQPNGSGS